jgi:hypothetical protein
VQRSILGSGLSLVLLSLGGVRGAGATPPPLPIASLTIPSLSAPVVAQTSSYDSTMRQGYRATAKRDYHNALLFFREALRQRPSDRYATRAIDNVSRYISDGQVKHDLVVILPSSGPGGRTHASVRTESCGGCLVALIPKLPASDQANLLATTANYPNLFFYIKPIPAKSVKFQLTDQVSGKTYGTEFPLPTTSRFLKINLATLKDPAGQPLPPLVMDRTYTWSLVIDTPTFDSSSKPIIESTITRRSLDPSLADTLQQGSPSERIALYATHDLWYDLVGALYQARQRDPKNLDLANQWTQLLETINLSQLAKLALNN